MADDETVEQDGGHDYRATAKSYANRLLKILAYISIALAVLTLIFVIIWFTALRASEGRYKERDSVIVVPPPAPTESFRFKDDFRVNTADQDSPHFIKMRLSLGITPGNSALSSELAQRTPQLRNVVNLVLGGKRKDQLSTIDDRLKLREELKASINHLLTNGKIDSVYFSEFIVN